MRQSPPFEAAPRRTRMAAKKRSKKTSGRRKAAKVQDLTDRGGRAKGGLKGEAYTFQALSSAVSDTLKNFGSALNTAARGG